jgi:hypothetical protein
MSSWSSPNSITTYYEERKEYYVFVRITNNIKLMYVTVRYVCDSSAECDITAECLGLHIVTI